MTCEELRDDYDLFALGLDDDATNSELHGHLGRSCPNCVPEVQKSLGLVMQLGSMVTLVDPPARLRRRIIAAVQPQLLEEPRRPALGWNVVWAAVSLVLLAMTILLGLQARHLSDLRREETARLREALSIMSAPDSREVTFGTNQKRPPQGRVVVNPRRGVVLIASNLPPLGADQTFELWLIPRGAKPIAAGTFPAQRDGSALVINKDKVPQDLGTVAVTVEAKDGAAQPTSQPIVAADFAH